jgi:hypothetical protein
MGKKPKKSVVQRPRERIYKRPVKDSWILVSDPAEQRLTKVTAAPSQYKVTRACRRHAQLAAARIGADPRLV